MFYIKGEKTNNESGFLMLLSILITSAIGVAITVSLILLGIGSSRTSLVTEKSHRAISLVDSCIENALMQVRDSTDYDGSGLLNTEFGSCEFDVIKLTGENRVIHASSTVSTVIRKAKVTINSINPTINITSWEELADF